MKKMFFLSFLLVVYSLWGGWSQAAPKQVVLGYSAIWYDNTCPTEDYNYDALTYLARSFLTPRPDGSIMVPSNFFNSQMESLAKKHGVKLLMSLGGEAQDAHNWLSVARHPEYFKRFCDELEKLAQDHAYDGVDIDWEPSALTTEDGEAYTSFLKNLRARFPKMVITTAMGAGDYWISHYPSWADIYESVDYINVMVYCYSGTWGGRAAWASNLYPPGVYTPDPGYSADEGMRNLLEKYKVPPKKLLIGLSFWGMQFNVNHLGDTFPKDQGAYCFNPTYPDVLRFILSGNYRELWDNKACMPYLERKSGGSVVAYENPKSIAAKCDYAKKMGFSGVMIWHLGADVWGPGAPLMDSLAKACGAPGQVFSRDFLEKQVESLKTQIQTVKTQLDQMNQVIIAAGKKAQEVPKVTNTVSLELSKMTVGSLETIRLQLEKDSGILQDSLADSQVVFSHLPSAHGKALDYGKPLLVADFEKGKIESLLGTSWQTDCDHNKLGTMIADPDSFIIKGGAHGSKFCARFYGHYGKSMAPWPYAVFFCDLNNSGQPADLSGFKAVQFWVKGNGKKYEVVLDNSKVLDYANFRAEFTAPEKWTKVELPLSSFHQPDWGAKVDWDTNAIKKITFEPSAMDDQDFDISIDDVTFIP